MNKTASQIADTVLEKLGRSKYDADYTLALAGKNPLDYVSPEEIAAARGRVQQEHGAGAGAGWLDRIVHPLTSKEELADRFVAEQVMRDRMFAQDEARRNKTASQIGDAVFTKLSLDSVRLDSLNIDRPDIDWFTIDGKRPKAVASKALKHITLPRVLGGAGLLGAGGAAYLLNRKYRDKKAS